MIRFVQIKRKYILFAVLAILTFVALLFSVRGIILRKMLNSLSSKINNHHYTAEFNDAGFSGIKTLFVKQINIISNNNQKKITIDSVYIKVKLLPLILKKIRIRKLDCRSIAVLYTFQDSLAVKKNVVATDTSQPLKFLRDKDLADIALKNIRRLFSYIPVKTFFGKIELRCNYQGNISEFTLRDFSLSHGIMQSQVEFNGDSISVRFPLAGKIDKSSSIIEINISKSDTSLLPAPLFKDKYGFETGFDSLSLHLDLSDRNRHLVHMKGTFNFTGFELKGKRLSAENIRIQAFKSAFSANIGNDYIEIDSSTTAFLNQIRLNPYVKLNLKENPELEFKIRPVTWDANVFFNSLPAGMFSSLPGIEVQGLLHYFLNFKVDFDNPDSLLFETRLTQENLKITKYGIDDYRLMNGSFIHHVYEKGRMVAAFKVGTENPDFTPFEQISPFLRAAVMTSEDGSFFYHNGFNPGAFRESIVTNIKEKRFARGGSTISMQLVKNVFLTRNKTLARKIEEALIVWLIENKNLVSKQRMYEVYLNIIEWGPGIYGINQASHFYFDKKPSALTLEESVYLASIVPHPKWYKYSFETNGVLKPFYGYYFNRLKELMVRKEFIGSADTINVKPDIMLTGPAAQVFITPDTTVTDSINFEELEFLPVL